MKIKYLISLIIIIFLTVTSVVLIGGVSAQEPDLTADVQYPVKELGNCPDEADCKSYCDKPENMNGCLGFAESHNLMSAEEIAIAKRFMAAGDDTPGGCKTKEACNIYCENTNHIDQCISFAIKHNLLPPEELEEAKKVQAAIARGIKPPACGNKKDCDIYCEEPDHMEECISFGIAAGFIQGKEIEDAQKMLAAVKRGVKPPPCKGKESCDEYCNEPDNMEVCMNFAIEAGLIGEQEKADAQKTLQAIKSGVKPPNCKGREECDVYCSQEKHFEECANFAVAAGFMTQEEAEMARKTGGKGPGSCKNKEECDAFCNNPDNQETCFNFAQEHGLIPEADLKQMEEGRQKFKESLEQAPAVVLDCLNSQIGTDMVEKMRNNEIMPSREVGDKMRECFEKTMSPMGPRGPEEGPGMIPEGQTGPGGCKSTEECQTYCSDPTHLEECQKFMPPGAGRPVIFQKEGEMRQEAPGPVQGEGPEAERMREEMLQRAGTTVQESLSRLTPEMRECVISRLGQSVYDKLQAGDFSGFTPQDSENIQSTTIECVQQFKPQAPPGGFQPPET